MRTHSEDFDFQQAHECIIKEDHQQRITDFMTSGRLTNSIGMPAINPQDDRFMLCGNNDMLQYTMDLLNAAGFSKANSRNRNSMGAMTYKYRYDGFNAL
ncbi:MAG: ferredoxin--NADP+ reductase [Glaciecola sp.]